LVRSPVCDHSDEKEKPAKIRRRGWGPRVNAEPSTITNLNGFVGIGEARRTRSATLATGATQRLFFDVDNRFIKGEYVGEDGRLHHGTFAFT
jgi:hypothetical protein